MKDTFFVKDCMHENPAKVSADTTIYEAIQILQKERISGLTVVDENNQVIGVLSELDCLKSITSSIYNDGNADAGLVGEHMTKTVDSCSPEDDIVSVGQSMLEKKQRRRPVVKNGKLVGQVSCRNILWAVTNYTS